MRLTADLILESRQYLNAVDDREIDLRGNKIPVIENLGATENQFDCIDLSDNEIVRLDGFPPLSRLSCLILNNNRITRVSPNIGKNIPNIEVLILTGNQMTNLKDLDSLSTFEKLKMLSLGDNPVTKIAGYRLYTINRLPSLKVLDYARIKPQERVEAKKKYGGSEADLSEAKTFDPEEELEKAQNQRYGEAESNPNGPSQEQITAIKAAIANAQTLEEVQKLESALQTGLLPEGVKDLRVAPERNGAVDRMEE